MRGGRGAPRAEPGVYTATVGFMSGDEVTPIGLAQTFTVLPILR